MVRNQTLSPHEHQQHLRPETPEFGANDLIGDIIENTAVEVSRDIFQLESDIKTLSIQVDKRLLTKNVQDSLKHFRKNFDLYFQAFKPPIRELEIVAAGKNIATHGESVGHVLNRFSSLGFENRRLAQQIIQRSRAITNRFMTQKDSFVAGLKNYHTSDIPQPSTPAENHQEQNQPEPVEENAFDTLAQDLERVEQSAERSTERSTESSAENVSEATRTSSAENSEHRGLPGGTLMHAVQRSVESRQGLMNQELREQLAKKKRQFKALADRTKKTETRQNERIQEIKEDYDRAIQEIQQSKEIIEELKETSLSITKDEISERFVTAAEEERDYADFYRYSAFGYLAVLLSLATYLFVGVSFAGFEWIETAVRGLLALTLLAPFIYAAKESRLHRRQQQHHESKALDFEAMDHQQRAKLGSIAGRGLSFGNFGMNRADYYSANNQEILDRLDTKLAKAES